MSTVRIQNSVFPSVSIRTKQFARLRGVMSVLEIVFVGHCEVLVCLNFVGLFFSLAVKLIGLRTGCQFFKKKSIFLTYAPLTDGIMKRR